LVFGEINWAGGIYYYFYIIFETFFTKHGLNSITGRL